MAMVKLRKDRAVTIPEATLERLGITAGEEFELLEHAEGIMLVPRKNMPEDDELYHTPEWQQKMPEAFDDVAAGRVTGPFDTADESIDHLRTAEV